MSSFRERNDQKGRKSGGFSGPRREGAGGHRPAPYRRPTEEGRGWIWGWHAVEAALKNPNRAKPLRLLATEERAKALAALKPSLDLGGLELTANGDIARLLPPGAAHQGVALFADDLPDVPLAALAEPAEGVILVLDQVTDPQNVGAILRSAAAFGVKGVVMQDRRAPPPSGALAKAAAGALERVPCARVVNLSRALEELAELGWRAVGLAGEAEGTLAEVLDERPTVLVLGSEGEGLRRLVSEHCDDLARIPMPGGFESLNVASAAAIALYASCQPNVRRASREQH